MIRVRAGVFSLTPPAPPDDDGSYLRWHLLDHMPEQFQLAGMQHAVRYIADADHVAARIAGEGPLADTGNVMNYLVGEPVERTLDDFVQLGRRLAEAGRFPQWRPSLQMTAPALLTWYAAPDAVVSAEVVPWRPHRGIVLVVEQPTGDDTATWLQWLHTDHYPQLLATPGVAGAWTYATASNWSLPRSFATDPQYTTVVYLDDDPPTVAKALTPSLEKRWATGSVRPLFAGPLRTMIEWEAWR